MAHPTSSSSPTAIKVSVTAWAMIDASNQLRYTVFAGGWAFLAMPVRSATKLLQTTDGVANTIWGNYMFVSLSRNKTPARRTQ